MYDDIVSLYEQNAHLSKEERSVWFSARERNAKERVNWNK